MRPIQEIVVYDRHLTCSRPFAEQAVAMYGIAVRPTENPAAAVSDMDIVVTTTPSRTPVVAREWVSPGTHINAIGADAAGKQELDPAILSAAKVVVDDWAQASHSGEINVALAQGDLTPEQIYGSLGDIVAGKKPGRRLPRRSPYLTPPASTIQDLALALAVYQRAKARGLEEEKDFLQ